MGTYLSTPKTDKKSEDADNGSLTYGASCMQGWRESQEDAHNCILDFDKNVSLFAVYDGHGGSEVARYASDELPLLVKNQFYVEGDFEKALITAYLDFDQQLLDPSVVEHLTYLRDGTYSAQVKYDNDEEEKVEELNELYKEAKMPLEDIIMKYQHKKSKHEISNNAPLNSIEQPGSSTSSSSEVRANAELIPSNSSTVTDGDNTNTNGVNNRNLQPTGSTTVNGTNCGPSSSKQPNCTRIKSNLTCLVAGELENDEDEDDEMFEVSTNMNDSESSDDVDEEEDDEEMVEELENEDNNEEEGRGGEEEEDEEDDDEDDDGVEDFDSIFINDDEDDEETAGKDSGCTAVMALLVNNQLYVANAGDSRCVVAIDGLAHDMSKDHKPEDELELVRICAAGGKVSADGRVNGGLNLSRALGDHNYKKNKELADTEQMITALPDVSSLDMKSRNANFIVLACDGIWNSMSSQEVVDFIIERIDQPGIKLSTICEELFDACLAPNTLSDGTGCDNMTCIIVKLRNHIKRLHVDNIEDKSDDESVDHKKFKSDTTESESVH